MGLSIRSKDPLVLDASDADQIKPKAPPKKEQDPLVVGSNDNGMVKKKVGGDESKQDSFHTGFETPEEATRAYQDRKLTSESMDVLSQTDVGKKMGLGDLSPDAKEIFARAHNGKKKSDLSEGVTTIIDNFYPQTADSQLNKKRLEIKQSVLSGNQDAISSLKNNIVQSLQKQIDDRISEVTAAERNKMVGPKAWGLARTAAENDPVVISLRGQQQKVTDSINEFGKQSLVSSKDMEAWLKLDADHPNIQTSIAAEKLGKMSADRYGSERLTPNQEHDRMAIGFRLIMEGLQMDANEYLANGIPSKNPELLKKAQDKLATLSRYRDMYNRLDTDQFPDVGLDKTARFLGDIIAEKHPNKLIRTKEDVIEAGRIAEERNPGFMTKYGKFIDVAAQKQDSGTFIPRGGGRVNELVGGLVTDAAKNAADLLSWRARTFGYEKDKEEIAGRLASPGMKGVTKSGTEPTRLTYDAEGKAYRELPNENYSTLPWNNFFRFAGSSIPGLAEFVASEGVSGAAAGKAAGGFLKGYNAVGREIYATTGALIGTKNIYEGYEAAKLSKNFENITGLIGAVYLTSYNSNREFADANIKDDSSVGEAKKVLLANFLTMANAGVFHALNASPSKLVEKAISKAVAPDVLEVLEKNSWEQLNQKTANTLIRDKILPRAKAIVAKFGETAEGGVKMGTAAVIDQKIHDLAGVMTNTDYKPSTVEDNARAFVQQGLLMTMVGLPGMIASGAMPHTTKEALHQAGLYGPQYIDQINKRVENGELDPKKANGMIAMIKTMGQELDKAAQETTKDGTPLTVLQQRDLAIANFRKRAAATMEENGLPLTKEGVESESDKEIKNIKAQNNWLKIEETPTFKSVKSIGNEESPKPIKNMTDIDPVMKYSWEKDGQPVETSGAELIHHLETGDIYEKENLDDQKGDVKKSKDAESENKEPAKTEAAEETVGGYKPNIRDDYFAKANFFTPEEKDKFETLDDSGKDKMIDDKRAELSGSGKENTGNDAGAVVGDAIKEGKIPDNLIEHVQKDPEGFLREVADQALGYMRNEGERVKSDHPGAEQAARDQFGDKVVDAAIKLFPEETKAPLLEEKDNSKRAADLQGSYDRLIASGTDPDDPDMKRLKESIDNLSPKTQSDGNVKEGEGGTGQESSTDAQKGGEESRQKNDEEGVLTSDSGDGAEPPKDGSAPAPESKSPIIGIRDSIVNSDRVHRGLKPLMKEFVRSWGHNWTQLKDNIGRGFSPRKFVEETALKIAKNESARRPEKKRVTFSDYDFASLLFDRLDIQNNILKAQDVLKEASEKTGEEAEGQRTVAQDLINTYNRQLEQNEVVGRQMKSESGRALSAIQMMTKMDGELLRWTEDISRYFNGHVPDTIKDFVSRIEKEYKEKSEQLREHYEGLAKKAAEEAFKKAKKETVVPSGKKTIKSSGKDLADKIRGLRDKLGTNNKDALQSNLFGIPVAIADAALVTIANLVEAGAKLADAINEGLKDVKFNTEKDRNSFIAYLKNEEDPTTPESVRHNALLDIKSALMENNSTEMVPDAIAPLRKLMKSYIDDGSVKSLDELVNKTKEAIGDIMPSVDERDIRDAFSGYGMKPNTEGKLKSDLSKMKEQARAVSKYQDMLERPIGETKAQEQKRLIKAAELYDNVKGYMKEMGIEEPPPPTTPEGKKALALEQTKKRTQKIIEDLDRQIAAGERKERNSVEPDHELTVLRAEKKRLSDQLKEIDDANVSPEEKIKRVEDALNRQISNYERQIKNGIDPLRPKEDRPNTKQIEELRKRKNELKKEVEGLRSDVDPSRSPEQRALAKYNESLRRQISTIEEKIQNKDYTSDEKAQVDFSKDTVSLALEARLKKLQSDYYATKRAVETLNKPGVRKFMSFASTLKRAFVLSRISTFGRLGAAVGWNTIFEPAGEAVAGTVGYAASKVGFGRKINEQAERYGVPTLKSLGTMVKGEGAAFKALTNKQTWKDFVSDAKNGYSELSLMYGHGNEEIPKEARDTWMNIEHALEAFGRGHGAVKGVSKRMEFNRSYVIRKEALRRKGEDVDNPVIQQSIGAMAYQDAMRSILMEDNIVSKKYQDAIHELQKGGFGANFMALSLQEMMPIVKIPTNLVLNAGRATLGVPLAGGVIAVRGLIEAITGGKSEYGISKLSAAESDAILRNLRKGSVGMALMLGGFFAPNMFGSSHYYQKGTDQPDGMEEGEVKFFGQTIPKWLADNPYLVTMKIGASLRNAFNYYTEEKDQSAPQAAVASFVNTAISALKETPILGTPAELIKAAEGYGGNWFWYSQVKSTLEPGLLQEIAEDSDNRNGWYKAIGGDRIKRKPADLMDALKTGIPGLREQVDEK